MHQVYFYYACNRYTPFLLSDIVFQIAYRIPQLIHPFDDSSRPHPNISRYCSYLQDALPPPYSVDLPATCLTLNQSVHSSIFLTEQVDITDIHQGMCLVHHASLLLKNLFPLPSSSYVSVPNEPRCHNDSDILWRASSEFCLFDLIVSPYCYMQERVPSTSRQTKHSTKVALDP